MTVYGLQILSLKDIIKIDQIVLSIDIFHICYEFVRIYFFPFTACDGNTRGYYSEYGYSWFSKIGKDKFDSQEVINVGRCRSEGLISPFVLI